MGRFATYKPHSRRWSLSVKSSNQNLFDKVELKKSYHKIISRALNISQLVTDSFGNAGQWLLLMIDGDFDADDDFAMTQSCMSKAQGQWLLRAHASMINIPTLISDLPSLHAYLSLLIFSLVFEYIS